MSLNHDYEKLLDKFIKKHQELTVNTQDQYDHLKTIKNETIPDELNKFFMMLIGLRQFNLYASKILRTQETIEGHYAKILALIYRGSDPRGREQIENYRSKIAEQNKENGLEEFNTKHDELFHKCLKEIEEKEESLLKKEA